LILHAEFAAHQSVVLCQNVSTILTGFLFFFFENGGTMQQPSSPIESSSDDRLWALLAYILSPLVPIIILLMAEKRERPFLKAHNIQALILGAIIAILSSVLSPVLGIGCVIWVIGIVYEIILGLKANKGELVEIPLISNFVRQQGW
jgi:uncharacterized membrane protein